MLKRAIEQYTIQKGCGLQMTYERLEGGMCRKPTCGRLAFPAKMLVSPENKKELDEEQGRRLFYEIMRLIDEAEENRPEWLICENVKNLLSIDGGRGFFEVLTEMGGEGTLLNGVFTTRKITEYLKTESVSTLSGIMESQPDSRYYLSDEKVQQLLDRL